MHTPPLSFPGNLFFVAVIRTGTCQFRILGGIGIGMPHVLPLGSIIGIGTRTAALGADSYHAMCLFLINHCICKQPLVAHGLKIYLCY